MFTNTKKFPPAPRLKELIGPSFIILALGLGSGEIILWPYLVSNYGLGIAWGALLGLTFQYFINMEIERYALVKGESVFVGLRKMFSWAPQWFILSTFFGFGLPGIVAASAKLLAHVFGLEDFKWLAIGLLILIGLIISFGKTVYSLMENLTQIILILGVPFLMLLVFYSVDASQIADLFKGLVGVGNNYHWLPEGVSLATLLAAFAYSGAGGNLNLTQSIYIKEKGYGMGKYSEKMSGLFKRGANSDSFLKLIGTDFNPDKQENVQNFKIWWKRISTEHFLVFWAVGLFTIFLLMVLSYASVYNKAGNMQGIDFLINEGSMIGSNLLPWVGSLFFVVLAIMLFQTQLGVLDSTSRIMAENMALSSIDKKGKVKVNLSKFYFTFLWLQIIFGSILFLLNFYEPKSLIITGAVVNAVAMFVHIGLVSRLNKKTLPQICQPACWRRNIMTIIFIFFGVFSVITLVSEGIKLFKQ